ncbi:MAG: hypothetical protein EU532_10965 [Promethearchaeota archaeon]|nr:MAG: hypothetical protein EU532_10965 [Candidatus Lokiarchaeota archaeon]
MRSYDFYYWTFMITSGIIMTIISFFHAADFYNIFFNICLGLFIGGIIMAMASIILAEMSAESQTTDQIDHIDHIDHVDHLDHIDHVDHLDHIDYVDHLDHIDYVDHLDYIDHVDHLDHVEHADHFDHVEHADHFEHEDHNIDSNDLIDTTPAPFMLLFSTFLLVFGISGIILYSLITNWLKFLIFFITPFIAYFITHYISVGWKKMARSRYYDISSTQNLIGIKGEVVLMVDHRGGVIKIPSQTPLKFERLHVKPLKYDSQFEKGEKVYICDVKYGFLLVDNNKKLIKNRRF